MEKKKSIDKLNELAIRDIDTLKHVKEEEIDFIEYIAKGCSQEVPRLYDRVPPIIKYNRGNEKLIRIVLDYYRTLDSEMYEQAKSIYIDSITTYTRMQLIKLYQKNGRLEKDAIKRIGQENNMSDNQMKWVLSYLIDEKLSIYYISKYIIADLISTPYFGKMYDEDSGKAIKMLKDFFKEMKYGSPESSLEALGISSKKDIDSLIKQKAEYNKGLHNANVKPKNTEREER